MKSYGIDMVGRFVLERVSSRPTFNASRDKGRLIYDESNGQCYYGSNSEWISMSPDYATLNDHESRISTNESDISNNESDISDLQANTYTQTEIDTMDSENVKLTGTQYIEGTKYFNTSLPKSSINPTDDDDLVRKAYVDSKISESSINRYKVVLDSVYWSTNESWPGTYYHTNRTPNSVTSAAQSALSGVTLYGGDMIYVSYKSEHSNLAMGNHSVSFRHWERIVYEIQSDSSWRMLSS